MFKPIAFYSWAVCGPKLYAGWGYDMPCIYTRFPLVMSTELTLKAPIPTKVVWFCRLLKCFGAYLTNSVDPNQTAPVATDLGPHCLPVHFYLSIMLANICSRPLKQTTCSDAICPGV